MSDEQNETIERLRVENDALRAHIKEAATLMALQAMDAEEGKQMRKAVGELALNLDRLALAEAGRAKHVTKNVARFLRDLLKRGDAARAQMTPLLKREIEKFSKEVTK